jgi:hypothetical protein
MHHNRYQLKRLGQRATILGATFALAVAAFLPAASVFADGLNPLTERSLLLSSSAPGFINTDGSGNNNDNTTGLSPDLLAAGGPYAQPGTGPNGMKTSETFTFRMSTDTVTASRPVKAFTLQYCTAAAGLCQAPGDNLGDSRNGVYDALTNTTGRKTNAQGAVSTDGPGGTPTSDLDVHYGIGADPAPVQGVDFDIYVDANNDGTLDNTAAEHPTTGWTMAVSNAEDGTHTGALTGEHNMITLTSADGISPIKSSLIKLVFHASPTNYITNPGTGSFFVKMNTYDTDNTSLMVPTVPAYNLTTGEVNNPNIIDGGVTVANVMTNSILITTKVLETMAFSVGTTNRDTQSLTNPAVHGTCDAILETNANRLNMGDVNAENSLDVNKAYDTYSYWRLSSNSSGGATVYYSGNTLANTVGDHIEAVNHGDGTAAVSTPGTEQFGLAFVSPTYGDSLDSAFSTLVTNDPANYHNPRLTPFNITPGEGTIDNADAISGQYLGGEGTIYTTPDGHAAPGTATFAFKPSSQTVPVPIAEENTSVISCATAKMRYVANIAADTPAGVYTTKINYLAAPQY